MEGWTTSRGQCLWPCPLSSRLRERKLLFFPFGTEEGCAPAVKSCARRKSDLARPGIFFVKDLKTCSQLALLILKDSDTFD